MLDAILQAGVIPFRAGQICLVTSRSGKRWVVPKGCMGRRKTAGEVALQEAWEEAGLLGSLHPEPLGSYVYAKLGKSHHVTLFLMLVTEELTDWPEAERRQRRWLRPARALSAIGQIGLRRVLRRALASDWVELRA